ncbi:MAG TPA: hypothetical protein VMV32_08785 [Ignavibacteriaceae bacterium]|jgi:hypothetical protein|nr:hypothetical protein [Ignavibacteriaceae bacterium]
MATWTLSQIRQKVRQVTGRFTSSEITNVQLDTYINQYYQLRFPSEVKLEAKLTYYQFTTSANQAFYNQPLELYTNYQPPATCNNLNMLWYQNPAVFFENNPLQYTFLTQWTGDGATVNFTTTVTGFPIFPGTLTVSDNVELFQDDSQDWTTSNVNIIGNQGGLLVINYEAGTVNVTFNTAPANGQKIFLNYVIFAANRPQALLMYNNQFQLFPVPDQEYIIKMPAYIVVLPLVNATDTPDLNEWGPCIAYGTARDIFSDYGELDAYNDISNLYKEEVSYILTRTCQSLLNTRALPNF